jgi:hypothetical protein
VADRRMLREVPLDLADHPRACTSSVITRALHDLDQALHRLRKVRELRHAANCLRHGVAGVSLVPRVPESMRHMVGDPVEKNRGLGPVRGTPLDAR